MADQCDKIIRITGWRLLKETFFVIGRSPGSFFLMWAWACCALFAVNLVLCLIPGFQEVINTLVSELGMFLNNWWDEPSRWPSRHEDYYTFFMNFLCWNILLIPMSRLGAGMVIGRFCWITRRDFSGAAFARAGYGFLWSGGLVLATFTFFIFMFVTFDVLDTLHEYIQYVQTQLGDGVTPQGWEAKLIHGIGVLSPLVILNTALVAFLFVYLMARLSPFPGAVALGHNRPLTTAWRASRGHVRSIIWFYLPIDIINKVLNGGTFLVTNVLEPLSPNWLASTINPLILSLSYGCSFSLFFVFNGVFWKMKEEGQKRPDERVVA